MDSLTIRTLAKAALAIGAVAAVYQLAVSRWANPIPDPRVIGAWLAVLLAGVALFQIAAAAGAPVGAYTQGGTHHGVLPRNQRIAAGVSAAFLVFVIVGTGITEVRFPSSWTVWHSHTLLLLFWAYSAIGVVANAVSRSWREALVWTPVTLVGFYLSLVLYGVPIAL